MLEVPQTAPESLPVKKRPQEIEEIEEDRGKKRSRGRPRLDTKDETAQDRRRTQIRLAQRAYRNRKDTAIISLEDKVKDLEDANENMSKEFMNFFDFVLSQGMLEGAPEVARRLNDTTRKFLSLTSKSAEDSSRDDSNESTVPTRDQNQSEARPSKRRTTGSGSGSDTSRSASDEFTMPHPSANSAVQGKRQVTPQRMDGSIRQQATPPLSLPYEIITMPTTDNASFPVYDTRTPVTLDQNPFLQSPFPRVPSPSSYASHERSFGRRFQRATLEAGLRLVSMANPPPHRYAQVFGFCLLFEPRESIIRRLSGTLAKISQESMYFWKFPFTNLGGAGTFFPNNGEAGTFPTIGANGQAMPLGNQGLAEPMKPPEMTGFSMGPFNEDTEATKSDRIDARMRMMYKGFEGDFFDADEVEVYLRQRGIIVPANVDFIDAEIDLGSFDNPSQFSGLSAISDGFFGSTQVPTSSQGLYMPPQPQHASDEPNMWQSTVPTTLVNTTSSIPSATLMAPPLGPDVEGLGQPVSSTNYGQYSTGISSYVNTSYFPRDWPTDSSWMKTKVTIDVNRLVAEMTSTTVCLGRTPGVRPGDINNAVRSAIVLTQS
ncbi:hypothetical protein ACHAPA_008916 [Fusarium lateritium]